jgi:short-subunit dehydrogenase
VLYVMASIILYQWSDSSIILGVIALSMIPYCLKMWYCFLDTASKHAIQSFSDTLRAEVADDNIHVCVVNPGYIRTNLSHKAMCGDGSKYGGKV